ncbi:14777_t:CDS:2 [Funneliformis geosporum]|uniref:18728_t:CDS:1 n=1 Tax=Funneliformis geosporum TaxID=1117311 RepID=A0A9W4SKJ0_9GLOM|nr:14777_t:CDS:2 [Funneliformis geosporum]CAI2172459.1 18728_t:CDS:2 [Funneliformis geosporum]
MYSVPTIETIHSWRQSDVMKFIQRVERLHSVDKNFNIIEKLNLTPVRLLKLTDEKLDSWVVLKFIHGTQSDILENVRDKLAKALITHVETLMQQPQATWFYGPVMERLNLDIAFGIDITEQYSLNNLLPYLKIELKKPFTPKIPRVPSNISVQVKREPSTDVSRENSPETPPKEPPNEERNKEFNRLIVFQSKDTGVGFCLRHHICKYIAFVKGPKFSEGSISKHVSADMEEMQFAKFPVEQEEREFIKHCQVETFGIRHLNSGHVKISANNALELLRKHGINRVSCEVFMEQLEEIVED